MHARAADALVNLGQGSTAVVNSLLALLQDNSFSYILIARVSKQAAKSLITLGKRSNIIELPLVQWIEQHQTVDFAGNGVDVLWTLVSE